MVLKLRVIELQQGSVDEQGKTCSEMKLNDYDFCRENKQTGVCWYYHASIIAINLNSFLLVASPIEVND